jgi:hypothetical protein
MCENKQRGAGFKLFILSLLQLTLYVCDGSTSALLAHRCSFSLQHPTGKNMQLMFIYFNMDICSASFAQGLYRDLFKEVLMETSNQLLSPYTAALRLRQSNKHFTCILRAQKCEATPLFLFTINLIGFFSSILPNFEQN